MGWDEYIIPYINGRLLVYLFICFLEAFAGYKIEGYYQFSMILAVAS